jgi:hypothetical protein
MNHRQRLIGLREFRAANRLDSAIACVLLMGALFLCDAAVVTCLAGVATVPQVIAGLLSYLMISLGGLFTLHAMKS